jgi:hypothetical protein
MARQASQMDAFGSTLRQERLDYAPAMDGSANLSEEVCLYSTSFYRLVAFRL